MKHNYLKAGNGESKMESPQFLKPQGESNASGESLEMIRRLENIATFGQTAVQGANQIIMVLHEIGEFLKDLKMNPSKISMPDSVLQNFLDTRLSRIRSIVMERRFKGRPILGGEYSPKVILEGKGLRFVKALRHLRTGDLSRLPVQIYRKSTQSVLVGASEASDQLIQRESSITLIEGTRFLRYKIKSTDNSRTLAENLQATIDEHGFGISVALTGERQLALVHNQYGSSYTISAISEHTTLLSDYPGELKNCEPGLDIQGSIGEEKFIGNGKFLIGPAKSQSVPGLIINYNGTPGYTGEVVGYVTVSPHSSERTYNDGYADYYCVPSMLPESLSVGVENRSNILSLAGIKGNTVQNVSDSIVLTQWATEDIELFLSKIRSWESRIIDQTLSLLRDFMISPKKDSDLLLISKDKAEEMSIMLKEKLATRKALRAI